MASACQETAQTTTPAKPGINIAEMLGPDLMRRQDGAAVQGSVSDLDGKYVLLYFSAHWCPPCRAFTPVLKQTYGALRAQGKPLEVVFVSSDSSKAQFEVRFAGERSVTFKHILLLAKQGSCIVGRVQVCYYAMAAPSAVLYIQGASQFTAQLKCCLAQPCILAGPQDLGQHACISHISHTLRYTTNLACLGMHCPLRHPLDLTYGSNLLSSRVRAGAFSQDVAVQGNC